MDVVARGSDDGLRRVGCGGAPRVTAEQSGGADARSGRMGCEIAREESIAGGVAVIVPAVKGPAAGVAIAQTAVVLRNCRCYRERRAYRSGAARPSCRDLPP